jgi:hypothetical protein
MRYHKEIMFTNNQQRRQASGRAAVSPAAERTSARAGPLSTVTAQGHGGRLGYGRRLLIGPAAGNEAPGVQASPPLRLVLSRGLSVQAKLCSSRQSFATHSVEQPNNPPCAPQAALHDDALYGIRVVGLPC